MTKVQTNSQGKVYITSGGKALLSSGGSDTIYLPNNSGSTITAGSKVLTKDDNYCSSVLLRKGETAEGWSEITQEEYDEIVRQQEEQEDE